MVRAIEQEPRRAPRRRITRRILRQAVEQWTAKEPLRFHMLGIVTLAGGVGFGASVALLALGVGHMWIRYPLAALLAYTSFLACVGLWLRRQRRHWLDGSRPGSLIDPLDLLPTPDLPLPSGLPEPAAPFEFGGGDFGGGGAGGHFDAVIETASTPATSTSGSSSGPWFDLGLDDAVPLLVAALIVVSIVVAGVYLVWIAPALLGDVLLDGLVAGVAYRRLRRVAPERWLAGAWRRTWKPAVGVVVSLALCGACAEWLRPGADSIGDLVRRPPTAVTP